MSRAYSGFEVKALGDRRTFSGWATTPATDRVNDRINPLGVRFVNPLALLHQHDHRSPIGQVRFRTPTAAGIEFDAEVASVAEPPELKSRLDIAWNEVKHGLVRFVSIGFKSIKRSWNDERGGCDFDEIEVFELSTVTVPALPEAVITAIKSLHPSFDIDTPARNGAVKLLPPLPAGAVRLTR